MHHNIEILVQELGFKPCYHMEDVILEGGPHTDAWYKMFSGTIKLQERKKTKNKSNRRLTKLHYYRRGRRGEETTFQVSGWR